MAYNDFLQSIRTFFGLSPIPPRNDFRNPIWSSDDEDDGDELYTRQQNMDGLDGLDLSSDLNQEFRIQMHDMMKTFGSLFGEFKSIFNDEFSHMDAFTNTPIPENPDSELNSGKNIRDYYLKPGYNHDVDHCKEDIDLDGKVSSHEISGLLKQHKKSRDSQSIIPFNGNMIPGRSFCQTVITTSVTKPDGSIETRRIVKKGNEVIEETTTTTGHDIRGQPGLNPISSSGFIHHNIWSELSSLFPNFH